MENNKQDAQDESFKKVSKFRVYREKVRYLFKSLTSKSFRIDRDMARYGIGDAILTPKQIKNILTYQVAKSGLVQTELVDKKADLLRQKDLQNDDSKKVIIGNMGVAKSKKMVLIASDFKGKLFYSTSKEFGIHKWRKFNKTQLENAVRSSAGEINVPLVWHSEFYDPKDVDMDFKGVDTLAARYQDIEKEFVDTRVYNQNFANLEDIKTEQTFLHAFQYVNVDRSYLQALGLAEGDGNGKFVSLKLKGGDNDMYVLEGKVVDGRREDVMILKNDYLSYLDNFNIEKIGDLSRGVSLLRVQNGHRFQIGNQPEILTYSDFLESKRIHPDAKKQVLDNYSSKNYHLENGKEVVSDSHQTVEFRTHAATGRIDARVKIGSNRVSNYTPLTKDYFSSIFHRLSAPNNAHIFDKISEKSGIKLPVNEFSKTRSISR